MKILLVEDSPGDARLFAELLSEIQGRPFQLTTVGSLAAALDVAAHHDVVFLDLSLPDAHGIDTVTRMVAAARNLPIVVLTGNDDDRVAVDAMKAGAQDYLHKGEVTPSLIGRTARYAVERKAAEENTRRLAASDEAARRARYITSVTSAITSSFDLDSTLPQVAKLLVPTLGDYAVIDLVREDGAIDRVANAAHDPAFDAPLREMLRYVPGTTYPRSPVASVIESREQLLIPMFDIEAHAPDDKYRELTKVLEPRTMLVTPMLARGRIVGTITTVMAHSGRTFDTSLCQLACEVADRIALGIDNASLYNAAQRAIHGRDELLAVVSHDLRNPLNLVGLALQMIEGDPEALQTSLPSAKRGVDRMQRLIEDLLDVARIDSGTLSVEPRAINMVSFLEEMYEQHRALATDKKITLVRDFDKRLGGMLADRHRMGQAVSNLIGNALKFTPAGGSIRLGAEVNGDQSVLWVADSGPGIAPDHVSHIFDRFWQPTRGSRDGVGLGLAIVKGIVDAHGGSIDVESIPGAGTTFRIKVRAAEARPTTEMKPLVAVAQ